MLSTHSFDYLFPLNTFIFLTILLEQVHGFVEDVTGKKFATLFGKWDESMYFVNGDGSGKVKDKSDASLLWKKNELPLNLTRYNLTSFAITLNELTPGLKVWTMYPHPSFLLLCSLFLVVVFYNFI